VRAELTDKIRAFAGKPGGGNVGISHSARQTAPIYLGTSGAGVMTWPMAIAAGALSVR